MRENPDDNLGRHEARDQRECDREPTRVRVGANLEVRVSVARMRMSRMLVPGVLATVLDAVDTTVGAGSDTFRISTGTGYTGGGTLVHGNVQVHE